MADPEAGGASAPIFPRWLVLGAAALLLAALGLFAAWQRQERAALFAACPEAARVGARTLGGPFELRDAGGTRVTDAELLAKGAMLVSFGDGARAARNGAAARALAGRGLSVTAVSIGPGPAPEGVLGLSGPAAAMERVAAAYGAEDAAGASFLVVPGRGTVARFPDAPDPQALAAQAECFLIAAGT